jgi:dihydroflavonol-4-reductase
MKVLVVGATGFVGSQVAQALSARGHQTRVLVRGGRAHPRGSQFEGRVEVVDGDLRRPETLASARTGIEAVVCTATSMPQCHENGLLRVDHDGVASLVQAAEKAGAKKSVYTSYSGNIRYDSLLETAKRSCESLLLNSAMWAVIPEQDTANQSRRLGGCMQVSW